MTLRCISVFSISSSILLGSRGFDVPKLSHKLEALNAAKTLDAIEPVWETDIEVHVRMYSVCMTSPTIGPLSH